MTTTSSADGGVTTRDRRGATRTAARARPAAPGRWRAPGRVTAAGRPMRFALLRVPFVIALIAILACGAGGVLYLNTKTDESGMRTEQAKSESAQMRLQIEALTRQIAHRNATPELAEQARSLGLVPAGDAAMLVLDGDGGATVIGTPHAAAGGDSAKAGQ